MKEAVFAKTILPSGVRLVTETHPGARTQNVGLFVDIGTRDEPEGLDGAAHFVEHMVFKGTEGRSAFEIAKSIEAVGGDINAFTSREHTCFHLTVLAEDLKLGLDVLCDIGGRARFSQADFEKERNVILQEIDMTNEDLEEAVFDDYFAEAFKGHALSKTILGTPESLNSMSMDRLNQFYQSEYRGKNLILSVVGPSSHEEVLSRLKDFEPWLAGDAQPQKRKKPEHRAFQSFLRKPSEQVHLLVGLESSSYPDPLRFEAYIVNALLGGGMTSKLYQKIREEAGLVYTIYSFLHSYVDMGVLQFYAGASPDRAGQVLKMMGQELKDLVNHGIKKEELDFFKQQVRGQILIGADDLENRMNSIGVNELVFGEYRPVAKVVEDIEKVTLESVQNYIDGYFKKTQPGLMVVGDISEEKSKNIISELEAWL